MRKPRRSPAKRVRRGKEPQGSGEIGISAVDDLSITGGTVRIEQAKVGLHGFNLDISGGDVSVENSETAISVDGRSNEPGTGKIKTGLYVGSIKTSVLGGTVTVSGGSFSEPVDPKNLDESLNAELYSAGSPTPYSYHTDVEAAQNVAGPGDVITDLSGITTEDTTTRYQVILKNGNGTEQVLSIASGAGIVLPVPDGYDGYIFQGWQDGNGNIYQAGATVTIGADTTFTAEWAYIPPADPSYRITIADAAHGTVTADPAAARQGTTVTLTVTPEEGYAVDEIIVTDFFGSRVDVTRNIDGTYSFVMPYSQVEVDVTFTRTEEPIRFTDVPEGAYYYDAVYWAVENGVTVGATATTFNPGGSCTRAQMVTFLWRAASEPGTGTSSNPFTDVDADDYYCEAVLWAVENGITVGATATTFAPVAVCTRAQAVTFLYRDRV